MKRIYEIIQDLKGRSGKNAKIDILLSERDNELLKDVLRWTYDPFITYGIKKWPSLPPTIDETLSADFPYLVKYLLRPLSERMFTGDAASEEVFSTFADCDEYGQAVLECALNKTFDAGIQASTINKVWPDLIPTFDVMLAQPFNEKKLVFPCNAEIKFDGARALCFVSSSPDLPATVNFFTRSGKPILTMDHLKSDCVKIADGLNIVLGGSPGTEAYGLVLDGEIMSDDFQKTMQTFRRKDHDALDAYYHVFDWAYRDVWDDRSFGKPQRIRREALVLAFEEAEDYQLGGLLIAPSFTVNSVAEVRALYTRVHNQGHEGLILKDPDALYERKRSWGWIKVKSDELPENVDLAVVGVQEGTGKYVGMLGAMIVDFKGVRVHVGSGLSDDQRVEFWEGMGTMPIGSIIEVEYHEVTPDGSLRHPRFVKIRHDKSEV